MKLSTEAMNTHCLIHNDKQCIHVISGIFGSFSHFWIKACLMASVSS